MRHLRRRITAMLAGAPLFSVLGTARAEYPDRPVRIVVGYTPGGTMDTTGRLMAQGLSEQLNAQFLVDNRPGASGTLAAGQVAKSAGDGYTLFVTSVPPHGTLPLLYPSLSYSPEKDLRAIAPLLATQYVMVVHPSLPAHNLTEMATVVRKESGKFEFASPGVGTAQHMLSELFGRSVQAGMIHVPYKGSAALLPDLFSGRVRMAFENLAVMIPHIRKGSVRPLAVSGLQRSAQLPDVPTVKEAGFPELEQITAFGLFAPASTPDTVIERLNKAVNQVIDKPDFAPRIAQFGALPLGGSPQRLNDFIEAEKTKWSPIIKDLKLRLE